jgi:hypothetical protein
MRWPATIISLLLGLPPAVHSLEGTDSTEVSLTDLAASADLVALAQVKDTDYFTRRNIPVSGSAYLKILIPYKLDQDTELVEIYENGLHPNECYFPNPSVLEEGRRYLVFLVRDAEDPDLYRGLPQGCALDVLVTRNNRYALRFPVTGIRLADDMSGMARKMEFSDPYAILEDESLEPALRDALLDGGYLAPSASGHQWIYTRGVDLEQARRLIDLRALRH